MSQAGRHRPSARPPARSSIRPSLRPSARVGARTTATLTVLTLAAAIAVPAALVTDEAGDEPRPVRGAAAGSAMRTATDQIRSREWHLGVLHATKAWHYSKGGGITVAVLDTGVDKGHPDLTGRVVTGPDLTGGARRPGGRYWGLHGTSMASIIAGHGHGPGSAQGMLGIAPQSRILSIRVTLENNDPLRKTRTQNPGDDRDAVAQGIRYAVDHGAQIINMSLGGGRQAYNGNPAQENAIKYALGKGVVLIASAGNDGSGADRKNFPAAYPGVIAVGALDRKLHLWKDSNRNSHASVCAPGVDIVSADASNGYVVGTGTSASSAMVAGIAALIRSRYPKLSPDEVRQALVEGSPARRGHPTGTPNCAGTVDAFRALVAANTLNKTSRGPVEPAPTPTASATPAAKSTGRNSSVLLPLVLGGGGVLVVIGLVLGWRQRRRPDDEPYDDAPLDDDPTPGYTLPGAPAEPAASLSPGGVPSGAYGRGMAGAGMPGATPPGAGTPIAPVHTAPFQSAHPYTGPGLPPPAGSPDMPAGPAVPEPFAQEPFAQGPAGSGPYVPEHALPPDQWDEAPWDGAAPPPQHAGPPAQPAPPAPSGPAEPPGQPPVMASELRPFVPGEFPVGDFPVGGLNGTLPGAPEGFTPNGQGPSDGRPANGHDHAGDRANGHGHAANGRHLTNGNGHDPRNGHDFGNGRDLGNGADGTAMNGSEPAPEDDVPAFDDEEWERFRRSALDGPGVPESGFPAAPQDPPPAAPPSPMPPVDDTAPGGFAAPPPVPPAPPAPPSAVPPVDDAGFAASPPAPPVPPVPPGGYGSEAAQPPPADPADDDARGHHPRRPYSSNEDDEYRPPWW